MVLEGCAAAEVLRGKIPYRFLNLRFRQKVEDDGKDGWNV
jgi:hypothetical protein